MSELYHADETPQRVYWDRRYYTTFDDQLAALRGATTLYVGNLNFHTTELQIHEVFSRVGPIKRIIMGLNRETKTPCGFCFVEYFTYEHACDCLKYVSGTVCDGNIIRCELDGGFKMGRQYGRGKSGGQIRDEKYNSANPPQSSPFRPPPPSSSRFNTPGSSGGGGSNYPSAWNSDRSRGSFGGGSGRRDERDYSRGSLSGSKRGREIEFDDAPRSDQRRRFGDDRRPRYSSGGGGGGGGYRSRSRSRSPDSRRRSRDGEFGDAAREPEEYTDQFGRRRVRGATDRDRDREGGVRRVDDRVNAGLSAGRRDYRTSADANTAASTNITTTTTTGEGSSSSTTTTSTSGGDNGAVPAKFQRRDRDEGHEEAGASGDQ